MACSRILFYYVGAVGSLRMCTRQQQVLLLLTCAYSNCFKHKHCTSAQTQTQQKSSRYVAGINYLSWDSIVDASSSLLRPLLLFFIWSCSWACCYAAVVVDVVFARFLLSHRGELSLWRWRCNFVFRPFKVTFNHDDMSPGNDTQRRQAKRDYSMYCIVYGIFRPNTTAAATRVSRTSVAMGHAAIYCVPLLCAKYFSEQICAVCDVARQSPSIPFYGRRSL